MNTLTEKPIKSQRARYRTMFHLVVSGRASEARCRWLCGCTYEFLIMHIQSQFRPNMNWSNRGLWHIDHRVAVKHYNFEDERQVRACFHYRNLQPLWSWENYAKGSKWNYE
jgi:hypothetical protein